MESIRVLIADDHPLFRDGIRALLHGLPGAEVAGEAGTGEEAVAQALALQPDLILMDIQMPGLNGIEAMRQILRASPNCAILMLTMFADDDTVFAAMKAGARGYVLKGDSPDSILEAVRAVAGGEAIFGPAIARRLMHYFAALHTRQQPQLFPDLTDREREILALMAQGIDNSQIAQKLAISPKTVRNNASNIFSKLQAADRAQAIIRAREAGLR